MLTSEALAVPQGQDVFCVHRQTGSTPSILRGHMVATDVLLRGPSGDPDAGECTVDTSRLGRLTFPCRFVFKTRTAAVAYMVDLIDREIRILQSERRNWAAQSEDAL